MGKNYKCKYCEKLLASDKRLKSHLEICIKRDMLYDAEEYKTEINNYKSILVEKDKQLTELKQQIIDLQNKLENIAIKAACRPTTTTMTNNTINSIIQKLEPITHECLESTVPQLTIEHIKKGPKGYAEYALEHPLKNRVVCVDYSRRKIKYKDNEGNVITDPEMNKLATKLFQSINTRNKTLITQYMNTLLSQVEYPEEIMSDMAEYMILVNRGASGEKTDLYHEFVKNVCSSSV